MLMKLASEEPNDDGEGIGGNDEAGRTRIAKGDADVVGKSTTFVVDDGDDADTAEVSWFSIS